MLYLTNIGLVKKMAAANKLGIKAQLSPEKRQ